LERGEEEMLASLGVHANRKRGKVVGSMGKRLPILMEFL
jgi:hypothetical protein